MKNKKQRRSLMAGILIGSAILLSGCGTDKIFVNEEDAYKIVNLSDRELENDKYYVKTEPILTWSIARMERQQRKPRCRVTADYSGQWKMTA